LTEGLCGGGNGGGFGYVPGQKLVDAVDRKLGDAGEDVAQVGLGGQAIELRGFRLGVD
jgi:hypothetical protein